jgi:O-antigen/teichoic acid export membrane protein
MADRRAFDLGLPLLALTASYASGFAVSKYLAVSEGPDGVGLAGAIMGAASIAASVSLAGQPNALPTWVVQRSELNRREHLSLVLRTTLVIGLVAFPVVCLATIALVGDAADVLPLALGVTLLGVGQTLLLSMPMLLVSFSIRASTAFTVVTSLCAAALTIALLHSGLAIAVSLGVGSVIPAGLGTLTVWLRSSAPAARRRITLGAYVQHWVGSSVGTVLSAVAVGGLPLIVVAFAGTSEAGIFRAAWTLATLPLAVSGAFLRTIYLPRAAVAAERLAALRHLNRHALLGVASLGAASMVGAIVLGPFALTLFYSSDFADAELPLVLLTSVSVLRGVQMLNGYALISLGRMRWFSTIESAYMVGLTLAAALAAWSGATTTEISISMICWAGLATLVSEAITRRELGSRAPGRSLGRD